MIGYFLNRFSIIPAPNVIWGNPFCKHKSDFGWFEQEGGGNWQEFGRQYLACIHCCFAFNIKTIDTCIKTIAFYIAALVSHNKTITTGKDATSACIKTLIANSVAMLVYNKTIAPYNVATIAYNKTVASCIAAKSSYIKTIATYINCNPSHILCNAGSRRYNRLRQLLQRH